MIEAVFVIRNGLCLFSRQYGKEWLDSDLVSGFLCAINQFTLNATNGSGIEMITMKKSTLSFTMVEEYLFVFKHGNMKNSKLKKVIRVFICKFFEEFEFELERWKGDASVFKGFEQQADKILNMKHDSIYERNLTLTLNC